MAVSFTALFHTLLVLFCIIVHLVVMFCMLLFNFVNYVFLLFCMCSVLGTLSLCCSVYCLCVNMYCNIATGCQPNYS